MCADWNQLFHNPAKVIREPDPLALEFARAVPPGARVLDLGCGAGRHLVNLAGAGFEVHGTDVAPQGLAVARQWLEMEGLSARLSLSDMTRQPYPEEFFDGILSLGVMNHAVLADTFAAVAEARRLLKPGAPFFFTLIGVEDVRRGEGEEIEPNTFVHHQGLEAGVPHHYFSRDEILQLAAPFARKNYDSRHRPYNDADPVFGGDPRARARSDAWFHQWAVRVWK